MKRQPFEVLYPKAPEEAIDLLNKMIAINPKERISIQEVCNHPFMALGKSTEFSEGLINGLKSSDQVLKLAK